MRRRRYWIVLFFLIGLVALCIYLSRPSLPGPGVTWANVDRIAIGMTQSEVEAIIGRLPQAQLRSSIPITENSPPNYDRVFLWSDTECDILVYLDRDGRVIGREGVGSRRATWYDRLRKRIGL